MSAAQWQAAGVGPDLVADWVAAGINATEAVRWHEFGFDLDRAKAARTKGQTPDDALHAQTSMQVSTRVGRPLSAGIAMGMTAAGPPSRFMAAGIDPRLMADYFQRQWTDDSALAWAKYGISASEAYAWHDLGLSAVEAARQVADGRTPIDVLRAWWPTGIGFDELAEWIGAGLTPDEAIEQRKSGVTVEQAAALRALRQGEEDASPSRPGPAFLWLRMGRPTADRSGPPPADEEAARTEIMDLFAKVLETHDDHGGLDLVQGGSNLGPSLEQARARVGGTTANTVTTLSVTAVRFINARAARVAYDLDVRGGFNTRLNDRLGAAVLTDDGWRVTRETVTELLAMAGVTCPPTPD